MGQKTNGELNKELKETYGIMRIITMWANVILLANKQLKS